MDTISFLIGKKAGGGSPAPTPTYQDKEITISTNGTQTVSADSGYDALNSVEITTNVPQPSGKISITQNGTNIDVSSYASADVNVPAGADLSEYFNSTIAGDSTQNQYWGSIIKKIPPLTSTGREMRYAFYGYNLAAPIPDVNASSARRFQYCLAFIKKEVNLDLSNWTFPSVLYSIGQMFADSNFTNINMSSLGEITSNIYNGPDAQEMFLNCTKLTKVDLSNFSCGVYSGGSQYKCSSIYRMFYNCTALTEIDMSSFDFTSVENYTQAFGTSASNSVPNDCLILVKDQTQKNWINTNFSRLTNVQIKSEYLANQGA